MARKSSKGKTDNRNGKSDYRTRQTRWTQVALGVFGVILILSMLLSLVKF